MSEVVGIAGDEVVQYRHPGICLHQPVAQVGAEEAGAAEHDYVPSAEVAHVLDPPRQDRTLAVTAALP